MRTVRFTFALALLFALPALSADSVATSVPVASTVDPASPSGTATSAETNLDPLFGAVRMTSCEEQTYSDCLWACSGRAEDGSCGFYASQACLCQRSWADCPVCY